MNLKFKRPSAAMIVACVALVMAITGSAVAASLVTSSDIKDGTIRGGDVKTNAFNTKQISENTLRTVPKAKDASTVGGNGPGALKTRWFLLNEQGVIEDQSGGFTVIDAYQTNQNVYVNAGSSLEGKGLFASIAIQNLVDVDGTTGADPNFAGEASVSRCQIDGVVACAPTGAQNTSSLVVSPRDSNGTATGPNGRKRVYVQVTE